MIVGYCKSAENSPTLPFGSGNEFNGVKSEGVFRSELIRELNNSYRITIERNSPLTLPISTLKLTNQSLLTWDDYWVDPLTKTLVDPQIQNLNLQRNSLVYVNINTPRPYLNSISVEGNESLVHLYLHQCESLQSLDLTGCKGLRYVSLGFNGAITRLIAKNCNMPESAMEQLLRDFRPTITSNANLKGVGSFRKQYNTLLDLRGNNIEWSNPNISSKIRVLLLNNWVVKWDNNPPESVIPIQFYRNFVESSIGI